jgi:hypothetical protein
MALSRSRSTSRKRSTSTKRRRSTSTKRRSTSTKRRTTKKRATRSRSRSRSGSKGKRRKLTRKMGPNEGYCMKCQGACVMSSTRIVTKNNRRMMKGVCSTCGTKMNKILGKA